MRLKLWCSNPECAAPFDAVVSQGEARLVACPHCRREHRVDLEQNVAQSLLTACPACGGDELYVRKDFPQKLGLALVVVVAITSFVLFGYGRLLWAMGILVAMLIVDFAIYLVIPKLTVCYRCRAEFRDAAINPAHQGFDLATAEKYRG